MDIIEAMDRDIEVGIDRETTDLVDMLENKGTLDRGEE